MTVAHIGKSLLSVVLGIALLASIVAFVPGPFLVLAAIVVLPVESALLAVATAPHRNANRPVIASAGL
jgi:hypothetical protein